MNLPALSQAALPLLSLFVFMLHLRKRNRLLTRRQTNQDVADVQYFTVNVVEKIKGAVICCFGDIEASSFVIIITIMSPASQTALGESRCSRTTVKQKPGTRHDLRPFWPHKMTDFFGLESPPSVTLFCLFYFCGVVASILSLVTGVHERVVRQAFFGRAISHTQTYSHYIHALSMCLFLDISIYFWNRD